MVAPLTLAEQYILPHRLLEDLPLGDSGGHFPDPETASVRGFPFPYRAGIAISNDCDSQNVDCLFDWHNFVNGSKTTSYGDGLGLEVGDSFWVYGGRIEPALYTGNPFDEAHRDGYALDKIVELGRMGWLDTLHSFGNWTARLIPPERAADPTIHSRDQIQKGLDRLNELGLRPYVYVNHSGSPSNVGGPWGWYQRADDPEHGLHSLDLLKAFGLRYFWLDSCTQIDKFGENLAYADPWSMRRALDRFKWFHWVRQVDSERRAHPARLPDGDDAKRELFISIFNRQLLPVEARDGEKILAFKRYRDVDQPVGPTFSAQVTAAKLDMLEERRGNVVIYQHFGVYGPRGRSPAVSRPNRLRSPIPSLDEHSVATWRMIADRRRSGRLFVATVGRLLEWLWLRSVLDFSVERQDDAWLIHVRGVKCAVRGERALEGSELNGLAFTVPGNAPQVRLTIEGRNGEMPVRREADPVHPGLDAIYLPWESLEWPE